jgi:hypothetical protein
MVLIVTVSRCSEFSASVEQGHHGKVHASIWPGCHLSDLNTSGMLNARVWIFKVIQDVQTPKALQHSLKVWDRKMLKRFVVKQGVSNARNVDHALRKSVNRWQSRVQWVATWAAGSKAVGIGLSMVLSNLILMPCVLLDSRNRTTGLTACTVRNLSCFFLLPHYFTTPLFGVRMLSLSHCIL